MVDCFMKELFKVFGKKEVIGIYLLGSANKKWDSEIDYIPGFSDVDLNVYMKNPEKFNKYFLDIKKALQFSKNYEKRFLKKIPHPTHIPRLQALLHNIFINDPNYLAPAATVRTLYGADYAQTIPSTLKKTITQQAFILEYEKYYSRIPSQIMSADHDRLIRYIKEVYYRTGVIVNHLLCMKGIPSDKVMSLNKTQVILQLKKHQLVVLAKEYDQLLRNIIRYRNTNDIESVRNGLRAGYGVMGKGITFAKNHEVT